MSSEEQLSDFDITDVGTVASVTVKLNDDRVTDPVTVPERIPDDDRDSPDGRVPAVLTKV